MASWLGCLFQPAWQGVCVCVCSRVSVSVSVCVPWNTYVHTVCLCAMYNDLIRGEPCNYLHTYRLIWGEKNPMLYYRFFVEKNPVLIPIVTHWSRRGRGEPCDYLIISIYMYMYIQILHTGGLFRSGSSVWLFLSRHVSQRPWQPVWHPQPSGPLLLQRSSAGRLLRPQPKHLQLPAHLVGRLWLTSHFLFTWNKIIGLHVYLALPTWIFMFIHVYTYVHVYIYIGNRVCLYRD